MTTNNNDNTNPSKTVVHDDRLSKITEFVRQATKKSPAEQTDLSDIGYQIRQKSHELANALQQHTPQAVSSDDENLSDTSVAKFIEMDATELDDFSVLSQSELTHTQQTDDTHYLMDNDLSINQSSDEKLSDEKLSDEKLSDEKLSDEKLSDEKLSDEKLSDEKLSDEKLSDEKLSDEKLSDEKLSDEKLSDEKLSDEKLSDEKLSDEKLSDEKLGELSTGTQSAIAPTLAPATNQTHHPTGIAGVLGKLGEYVGNLATPPANYAKVELNAKQFKTDAFRNQSGQFLTQLFGTKGGQVQNLANKFLPDDKKQTASDWLYDNIAALAQKWALADLKRDKRFYRLADLDNAQKSAFLHDLNNQTRGLAVLGGVAGFFGLKGVVLDTAWLLLVSLKSIFQTAHIAGTPLTGKDGTRLAYGILAGANLDKMQEKQVLLTGLALGKTVLKNAQHTGLASEIRGLGNKHQIAHTEQLVNLAGHLDKLNGALVQRLLPVGSALVAGFYNGSLIDEVLGVAKASLYGNKDTPPAQDTPVYPPQNSQDNSATPPISKNTTTNADNDIAPTSITAEVLNDDTPSQSPKFWHTRPLTDKN